jgi:hypothetical protein
MRLVMVPLGPNTIWIWHEKSQEAPVLAVARHWPAPGRITAAPLPLAEAGVLAVAASVLIALVGVAHVMTRRTR